MKLNHDCIRDLLLYLEENLALNNSITINNINIKDYSSNELLYTADKLYEAKFLNCYRRIYDNENLYITVNSITCEGHQFLDSIRDNDIWKSTKNKASKLASVSLPIIQELATSFIKVKLGLP